MAPIFSHLGATYITPQTRLPSSPSRPFLTLQPSPDSVAGRSSRPWLAGSFASRTLRSSPGSVAGRSPVAVHVHQPLPDVVAILARAQLIGPDTYDVDGDPLRSSPGSVAGRSGSRAGEIVIRRSPPRPLAVRFIHLVHISRFGTSLGFRGHLGFLDHQGASWVDRSGLAEVFDVVECVGR